MGDMVWVTVSDGVVIVVTAHKATPKTSSLLRYLKLNISTGPVERFVKCSCYASSE